jgi:bla regulator protein BlaR1
MEYLLKVAAVVTIFYGIYKLFLQRDTFFESNRWFLLMGLVSSLLIPLIVIPLYIEYMPVSFENILITEQHTTEIREKHFNIFDYLPFIYGLGVVFFAGRFFIQLVSLIKLFHKNQSLKKDGYMFIETQSNTSPFSFFKWIVYNPKVFTQTELEHIIEHEKTHAKQFHSVDILISQLFCVLLWFNPFMWLYNKDLKQNLEFIADKRTLNQYSCKKSYQYTLLKTSMPSHQMALSNHFYNSLIKKRIVMLHKSKSKKINQLKYALVFPALLGFLISCNSELKENNPDNLTGKEQTSPIKIIGVGNNLGIDKQPLYIVDGREKSAKEFESLDINSIHSINVIKDENFTKKYGDKAKNGVVEIITKENANSFEGKPTNDIKVIGFGAKPNDTISFNIRATSANNGTTPLVIIDGKELLKDETLNPESVETMTVLKDENATKKYGDKGKNGVIEIISKK